MQRACNCVTEPLRSSCETPLPRMTERKQKELTAMIDEHMFLQRPRNKKRFDLRDLVSPVICGVAVTYLLTAALLGLLAR